MPIPRYTADECGDLGDALYEKQIRAKVEEGNIGRIVAIDVDSGDYELDDDSLKATMRLLARKPGAQVWQIRIGYPAVIHFGGSFAPRTS
jgi:hypothetical protein